MRDDYRMWLVRQKYDAGTVTAQMHRAGRVEKHYGDLDEHYAKDRLASVVASLVYTTEDKRRSRPNPSKIPFEGDIRSNLASYKNAIERYRRFRDNGGDVLGDEPLETTGVSPVALAPPGWADAEDLGQRIGLERDMQAALRLAIDDLEAGLKVVDEGAERFVESGRIDITCRDAAGAYVVIELKAGPAGQRAVAQVLSYMGDVLVEEADSEVRGILIASEFDKKAVAAARMAPSLKLVEYGVKFSFRPVST
ncbi:endonuclease NucS domain-containing protein [Brevundimonas sp. AAP58]|uniref:endonuclease NucS domain-containing protein n=1 Tax=Brevundimonas sp. AAP58 TaxID=1523422 RepID=UPI000AB72B53|nr:endonuclease NucS domain-containing protein [Brevundimonas sp. AAP58]